MTRRPWFALVLWTLAAGVVPSASAGDRPARHLYLVGGGYDSALRGYAETVIRQSPGPKVRMLMVPAAFADDPVLPEDPIILAEDVQALQQACEAVIDRVVHPAGCEVGSVPLYVAADARSPPTVTRLSDPTLNGIFFTGGDQGYAMRILAGTPSEEAMSLAADRGVLFGGTSAGAAIQSRVMNAGYTDAGDSTNGLNRGSIDLWFGRPAGHRGLSFGSRQIVVDEHVLSRGRLGRMVNASAQTDDALGRGGLLGVGFDYDTGAALTGDRWLHSVSGVSSAVVVDLRTARASHRWVGLEGSLSARRVLTHLLPTNRQVAFDVDSRLPYRHGRPVPFDAPRHEPEGLSARGKATLMLAGDLSGDFEGPALREFVRRASRQRLGKMVVIAAGHASTEEGREAGQAYLAALVRAGWSGSTQLQVQGQTALDPQRARDASAVVLVGGDQSRLPTVLGDGAFVAWVHLAVRHAEVVLLDRAMAAAAGEQFDAIGEGDTADDAINAFRTDNAVVRRGLGLVDGAAFEPRLQIDKRWGRLYGIAAQFPRLSVHGIGESSAIVLDGRRAFVVGRSPVVSVDARAATFYKGDNGALGALNVLLDVHQPGESLRDR